MPHGPLGSLDGVDLYAPIQGALLMYIAPIYMVFVHGFAGHRRWGDVQFWIGSMAEFIINISETLNP